MRRPAAERRRQIIEVTTGLIAERGFWGLSMQDVADGCGLTVPGLLHHVGSKDRLLLAVLDHRDAEDGRALADHLGLDGHPGLDAALAPDGPALSGDWSAAAAHGIDLRRLCAALVRRNASRPEIVRLFAVLEAESLAPDHPAHAYFVTRQERVLAALVTLARGVSDRPESLARQVMAMMDGLQIQWLRDLERTDLVTEWETAADVLFVARVGPRD